MTEIRQTQFSLRSMFIATSLSAVLIVFAQFSATHFPSVMVIVLAFSLVAGVVGFAFITTAFLFSVSILLTVKEGETSGEDLGKCRRIAGLGLLAFIPLFLFLVLLPFAI
jgi:DMSO/TMAO reductase YedYZ heme-binding membrane subunit